MRISPHRRYQPRKMPMFLATLATKPVYTKPTPKAHRVPVIRYTPGQIHYVQRPTAQVTACGIFLGSAPGLQFTVDRELLVDQCPSCRMAAWLPTKDNSMTRAGIDCRLYPAGLILTA